MLFVRIVLFQWNNHQFAANLEEIYEILMLASVAWNRIQDFERGFHSTQEGGASMFNLSVASDRYSLVWRFWLF
jgi:hypothetical protein